MLERVWALDVDFSDCQLDIYSEPRKGAALYLYGSPDVPIAAAQLMKVVSRIIDCIAAKAPPALDRTINIQEAETILCKWKSHCNDHYAIGKDIREVRHGLHGWGDLAEELLTHMPKEVK